MVLFFTFNGQVPTRKQLPTLTQTQSIISLSTIPRVHDSNLTPLQILSLDDKTETIYDASFVLPETFQSSSAIITNVIPNDFAFGSQKMTPPRLSSVSLLTTLGGEYSQRKHITRSTNKLENVEHDTFDFSTDWEIEPTQKAPLLLEQSGSNPVGCSYEKHSNIMYIPPFNDAQILEESLDRDKKPESSLEFRATQVLWDPTDSFESIAKDFKKETIFIPSSQDIPNPFLDVLQSFKKTSTLTERRSSIVIEKVVTFEEEKRVNETPNVIESKNIGSCSTADSQSKCLTPRQPPNTPIKQIKSEYNTTSNTSIRKSARFKETKCVETSEQKKPFSNSKKATEKKRQIKRILPKKNGQKKHVTIDKMIIDKPIKLSTPAKAITCPFNISHGMAPEYPVWCPFETPFLYCLAIVQAKMSRKRELWKVNILSQKNTLATQKATFSVQNLCPFALDPGDQVLWQRRSSRVIAIFVSWITCNAPSIGDYIVCIKDISSKMLFNVKLKRILIDQGVFTEKQLKWQNTTIPTLLFSKSTFGISGLEKAETLKIESLVVSNGGTIVKTHRDTFDVLIMNTYKRTAKLFMAIATGALIVNSLWINSCINNQKIIQLPDKTLCPKNIPRISRHKRTFLQNHKVHIGGDVRFIQEWVPIISALGAIIDTSCNHSSVILIEQNRLDWFTECIALDKLL